MIIGIVPAALAGWMTVAVPVGGAPGAGPVLTTVAVRSAWIVSFDHAPSFLVTGLVSSAVADRKVAHGSRTTPGIDGLMSANIVRAEIMGAGDVVVTSSTARWSTGIGDRLDRANTAHEQAKRDTQRQ